MEISKRSDMILLLQNCMLGNYSKASNVKLAIFIIISNYLKNIKLAMDNLSMT